MSFLGGGFDSIEYGIEPMTGAGNHNIAKGYFETSPLDTTTVPPPMEQFSSLLPDPFCPKSIVEDIVFWGLWHPDHNIERNVV